MEKKTDRKSLLSTWVPMPRYLLRRWVVRRLISKLKPNDFIEIGAASGEMAKWLSDRNIGGVAVEISPHAVEMLRERLEDSSDVEIFAEDAKSLNRETDLLLSMEVLEHIEDDHEALREWFKLVRPGGYLLLTVPAGSRLFAYDDEMVGHFRRYDKRELIEKIKSVGFHNPRVLSYGFPISFILRRLRILTAKRKLKRDTRSVQQRTEASGVERQFVWLRWVLNNFFFLPFNLMQMPFLRFDWTDGYIAVARKPTT